jgi:hypothetical protein
MTRITLRCDRRHGVWVLLPRISRGSIKERHERRLIHQAFAAEMDRTNQVLGIEPGYRIAQLLRRIA